MQKMNGKVHTSSLMLSERDVICWSVMIGGYVYFEKAQIGMKVHQKMVYELGIEPDGVTAVNVPKPALV